MISSLLVKSGTLCPSTALGTNANGPCAALGELAGAERQRSVPARGK